MMLQTLFQPSKEKHGYLIILHYHCQITPWPAMISICLKNISEATGIFNNSFTGVLGTVCTRYVRLNDFLHHFTHADAYLWSHPSAPRQISQTVWEEGASSCWQRWFSAGLAARWCAPPGGDKQWWSWIVVTSLQRGEECPLLVKWHYSLKSVGTPVVFSGCFF